MKIIKTASGKKTIKMSKKEWQDIGKKAGWRKKASMGGEFEATVYLGTNGLYSPHGDSDEGVDVIIEYVHHKAQPQTHIDPGIDAYNEIISIKRVDDGTEISNYDDEAFQMLMDEDVKMQASAYWDTKADQLRDERGFREE